MRLHLGSVGTMQIEAMATTDVAHFLWLWLLLHQLFLLLAALARQSVTSGLYLGLFLLSHQGCATHTNRAESIWTVIRLAASTLTALAGLPIAALLPDLFGSVVPDILILLESGGLLAILLFCRQDGLGTVALPGRAVADTAANRQRAAGAGALLLLLLVIIVLLQPCLLGTPLLLLPLFVLGAMAHSKVDPKALHLVAPCLQLYAAFWILAGATGFAPRRGG